MATSTQGAGASPHPSGFDAMGKPIPDHRRTAAYRTARDAFGLDAETAWEVVGKMATCFERDDPYGAQRAARGLVDLTGMYRLMAVLLAEPEAAVA